MSQPLLSCANCSEELKKVKLAFSSKCPHQNFTILDAIIGIAKYYNYNINLPVDEPRYNRRLCLECVNKLGSGYSYLKVFIDRKKEGSYLHSKFCHLYPNIPNSLPLSPLSNPVPKLQPTPVALRLKRYSTEARTLPTYVNSVKRILNKEIKILLSVSSLKAEQINRNNWLPTNETIIAEMSNYTPLLLKVLEALLCRNQKIPVFDNRMRSVVGILLNAQSYKANLFQKSIGLKLFMGKASLKTYKLLNPLGITCAYSTVMKALDSMAINYDHDLLIFKLDKERQFLEWRKQNQNILPSGDLIVNPLLQDEWIELEDDPQPGPSTKTNKRLRFETKDSEKLFYGGTFISDNINHVQQTLHANSKNTLKSLNMTSAAFIFNRIPQPLNEVFSKPQYQNMKNVPMTAFLPTEVDIDFIKRDHYVIVKRILVKHLAIFQSLANHKTIIWNIPHIYSKESSKKSEVVSLGILNHDQSTTEGTKAMIKFFKKYIPTQEDKKMKIVAAGDCLTCRNMESTIDHAFNGGNEDELLEGPIPAVGQFHLRMHLLSDIVKQYIGKSVGRPGRGTVPFLLSFFKHPEKIADPKHNFLLAVRGMKFCLVSYIVAVACNILNITEDKILEPFSDMNESQRLELLEKTSQSILEFEWHDILKNTNQTRYCFCEEDDEPMGDREYIACENDNCRKHLWYHVNCLKDANTNGGRFNIPNRNFKSEKNKYFCTQECKNEWRDKKLIYSKSFINSMLHFEGYRDAIRENDAVRMDAYNKIHLVEFYNCNHPNYLKVSHLWQARKHGATDPNIVHDLKYNSTINLSGGLGKNLESDLVNEMLNRYLKSMILIPQGHLTPASIQRRSRAFQIIKDFLMDYDTLLSEFDDGDFDKKIHHAQYEKWGIDIPCAVKTLLQEKLVSNEGEREHQGFKNFRNKLYFLIDATAYKNKLLKYSERADTAEMFRKEKKK